MAMEDSEIELTPHTVSLSISDNQTIWTDAPNAMTAESDSTAVLYGFIEALTMAPTEFQLSTTVDLKLVPFQNNAIVAD